MMATVKPLYNERAWAIDVISEIRRIAAQSSQVVVGAGGEWGVPSQSGAKTLFPDVLLYGDANHGMLLQGWELKMPDTPITDAGLIANAKEKAIRLSLDSFLVWNAKEAVLYALCGGEWIPCRNWSTGIIRTRADVLANELEWKRMLGEIVEGVNSFFSWHKVAATPKYAIGQITAVTEAFVDDGTPDVAKAIARLRLNSAAFRDRVRVWWKTRDGEFSESPDLNLLAREALIHEFNRILLANFLRPVCKETFLIDELSDKSTRKSVDEAFLNISRACDHFQVLEPHFASSAVPPRLCVALNGFLREINLSSLDQSFLQTSMQSVIDVQRRKTRGIYCTPTALARLLAELALDNLEDNVIDPCCGTGTVPRAVVDVKCAAGMPVGKALDTTWASDINQTAIQFTALSLVRTYDRATLRLFNSDVLGLSPGKSVTLVNASTGVPFEASVPRFQCAIFNPPFIRADTYGDILPKYFHFPEGIPERADYAALVILHVLDLLEQRGTIGVILPNSWLATDWGEHFRALLHEKAAIRYVVASANAKWFDNADIVATLLVAQKRDKPLKNGKHLRDETTVFATTETPIKEWTSETVMDMAHLIRHGGLPNKLIERNAISWEDITSFEQSGLGWQTFFADTSWLKNLWKDLKPITEFLDVARGSRRGWDKLFFPPDDCGVEKQYLQPVLKSPTSISHFVTSADSLAFCCAKSEDELRSLGHTGALSWIRRFSTATNGKGRPLPDVLARNGIRWYEMPVAELADFAMAINPGKRLFVARLARRSFVNQRLTRLSVRPSARRHLSVLHALMNSVVCLFQQEALGFPRGLGALDLSSTRIAEGMRIPNPMALSDDGMARILRSFDPVCKREILDLENEFAQQDRIAFEHTVAKVFGYEHSLETIVNATLRLFKIRNSVTAGNSRLKQQRERRT